MASINTSFDFKGVSACKLEADKYSCVIVPSMGSLVVRMLDNENKIEFFRYTEDSTIAQINSARCIWGLPTLYLPNRFDRGVIKTSDATYQLPINEPLFDNYIHGWVHEREHTVVSAEADDSKAVLVTNYTFGENDEMYKYFPLDFSITYTFTLSDKGLEHKVELKSLADKKLPVSICTHTCINAPIVQGGKQNTLRLSVPVEKICQLDERILPTEELLPLDTKGRRYKNGAMCPVLHQISNDMYTACDNTLDGEPFYGCIVTDKATGKRVCNEVSKEYKFWNMWNDRGMKGYFCPEPMTAMINSPNLKLPRDVSGYSELSKDEVFTCTQRFFSK